LVRNQLARQRGRHHVDPGHQPALREREDSEERMRARQRGHTREDVQNHQGRHAAQERAESAHRVRDRRQRKARRGGAERDEN